MQLNEICRFIYKVCGKNIPIYFVDTETKAWKFLSIFPAWISPKNELIINKNVWNTCHELIQKSIILHEVGHIEDPSNYCSSTVQRELFAQIYAIKKAESMRMTALVELLKYILSQWEFQYDWNSPQRRFILASKIAKKKGIVV